MFPLIGSALVLAGTLLLTRLGVDSSRLLVSVYLVVIGIGMGTMFQVFVQSLNLFFSPFAVHCPNVRLDLPGVERHFRFAEEGQGLEQTGQSLSDTLWT